MTTSGFLSPSREGKLPEPRLTQFPNLKQNLSQSYSSYSTVPPKVKVEPQQRKGYKKLSQKIKNIVKDKEKHILKSSTGSINLNNFCKNEGTNMKKITSMKETTKHKALKTAATQKPNQEPPLKKAVKIKDKSKLSLLNTIFDKPVQSSLHLKYSKSSLSDNEKLSTEPDKQKLNIFKKISKIKEEKNSENSDQQNSKSNTPIISKPNSTIVSSDILIKPDTTPEIKEKLFETLFFKPRVEKKHDTVPKISVKEPKLELNSSLPKKRKKKQKAPCNDPQTIIDPVTSDIEIKKSKKKHVSDQYPLKFSFFGHLPLGPGLLPSGPNLLPPSLASNPLVPKYSTTNCVLPVLEKASPVSPIYLPPLLGEGEFDKSKFDELSSSLTSEKKKVPPKKIKVNVFTIYLLFIFNIYYLFIYLLLLIAAKERA